MLRGFFAKTDVILVERSELIAVISRVFFGEFFVILNAVRLARLYLRVVFFFLSAVIFVDFCFFGVAFFGDLFDFGFYFLGGFGVEIFYFAVQFVVSVVDVLP